MTDEIKSKRSRSARTRGKRGEYKLRDYLRRLGWEADRVPTSGAAQGFKGDVKATKDGVTKLFELKNWSGNFATIYDLYNLHCSTMKDDLMSIVLPGEAKLCLDLSSSLDAVIAGPDNGAYSISHPLKESHARTFKKIGTLQKLIQECDYLVLLDDRRPFLFLRFR